MILGDFVLKKIIIGTAQFGMDYGISNARGKIPYDEVFAILNECAKKKIKFLDTAYSYGDSEKVIGNFIQNFGNKFEIISKLPSCKSEEVEFFLNSSLNKLGITKLYGYLIHNFKAYQLEPSLWDALENLKYHGKVGKIGFSLYFPQELEFLLFNNLQFDLIQIPYSIFDQRFDLYFKELKSRGVEIHVRSVFLQGVIFKKLPELSAFFLPLKEKIKTLNYLSLQAGVPVSTLALNFALHNKFIDKVIVGIDSIRHLYEIIAAVHYYKKIKDIIPKLADLKEDAEKILVPTFWPKE